MLSQTPIASYAKVADTITQNCIDCHMPKLESKVVYLDINGQRIRPRSRTHWIKIYSESPNQKKARACGNSKRGL